MAHIPGYFEKGNSLSQKNFLLVEFPPIYTDCIKSHYAWQLEILVTAQLDVSKLHDTNEGAGVIIQNSPLASEVYTS